MMKYIKHIYTKRRLSLVKKYQLVQLLADVLDNGFSLNQSLVFMNKLLPERQSDLAKIEQTLKNGGSLADGLEQLHFSMYEVAQVRFAEIHGDLKGTLKLMAEQLADWKKQKEMLWAVLSYPLVLLFFLLLMLAGLKMYLLPMFRNMSGLSTEKNVGYYLLETGPPVLIGVMIVSLLMSLWLMRYLRRQPPIERAMLLSRFPFIRKVQAYYCTVFFAREWGKLLQQGMDSQRILSLMLETTSFPLVKAIAFSLQLHLLEGHTIDTKIASWPFFLKGFDLIIQQGETKGKLPEELMIYSRRKWQELIQKCERMIKIVQPLLFLAIALIVLLFYANLLWPIYNGMEELM